MRTDCLLSVMECYTTFLNFIFLYGLKFDVSTLTLIIITTRNRIIHRTLNMEKYIVY